MKITSAEIRNHAFEKGFRGYAVEGVDEFLNAISEEWEKISGENKMLKMQLEIAEKELSKLKEVELALFKTLNKAEAASSEITEQASQTAEKFMQESRLKSEEVLNDARKKASMLLQDAENKARYIREEIENDFKNQERDFRAIEKYRESLLLQLRGLLDTAGETFDRFEKKYPKGSFKDRLVEMKAQIHPNEQNEPTA